MLVTQPDESTAGDFSGLHSRHRRMDVTESMEYEWVDGWGAHILVSFSIYWAATISSGGLLFDEPPEPKAKWGNIIHCHSL